MAGLGEGSGVANVARRFARLQKERGDCPVLLAPAVKWNPIYFGFQFVICAGREARSADEIWVHCSWTFPVWIGAFFSKCLGKKLIVVPEASFDPLRMNNHAAWKKRLVRPLDRWVLRSADEVLALCPDEIEWVRKFEPRARVRQERVPTFYPHEGAMSLRRRTHDSLHVLFLGRATDPLKGLRFLERAVQEINDERERVNDGQREIELRVVTQAFGDELEKVWEWCDVLCLPTLSDNFGLVVAEALEHGKGAITTDGASAWASETGNKSHALLYLRGYRSGTDAHRVELIKDAIFKFHNLTFN